MKPEEVPLTKVRETDRASNWENRGRQMTREKYDLRDRGRYWRAIDSEKREERLQRLWGIHGVHVITECFVKNCSSPNCTCTRNLFLS